MLYHGRARQPGAEDAGTPGASYRAWWLRSSLAVLSVGVVGSLAMAVLTWLALRLGGTAVLPILTGAQVPVGASPASEVLAGWSLAFFSSQLVPVQLWAAAPPGLAFGLGSPLLLVLLVAISFRAGLRLEGIGSGEFGSLEAATRAAAMALPQTVGAAALLALSRAGTGPLAGAPVGALALILPGLIVGGSAAAGAAWRRERRLGRGSAAGFRGVGLAAVGLAIGSVLAGGFGAVALLVAFATGQARAAGGFGTALIGLIYLPNGSVLAAAAGLGGGPLLGSAVEASLCALLTAGCFAAALHLSRRGDHLEQVFFGLAFPVLLLVAAVDSRPLVSDHTLGLTPGVAFWVGAVVAAMAAAAGPQLAESSLGSRLTGRRPLALLADLVPPVPEHSPPAKPARTPIGRHHLVGRVILALTAVVMATLITLIIVVPAPTVSAGPDDGVAAYLRLEAAGDAAGLWSRVRIDRSALPAGADTELLSQAALAAMLGLPANRNGAVNSIRVGAFKRTLAGSEYPVSYGQDGVRRQRTIVIQGGKVLVVPELLAFASSPGLGALSLDGIRVVDLRRPVAVLPGAHEVRSSGSGLWQPSTILVPPGPVAPRMIPVALAPALATAALNAAAAAVSDSFAGCQASNSATPPGCPQSLGPPAVGPITWQLIGDPGTGATFAGTDDVTVSASGQFQMVGSYAVHIPEGVRHQPSSGGFRMTLGWDGQGFSRGPLTAAPDAGAKPRPSVADDALKEAVRTGFEGCLASNLLRPPDCPQTIPSSLFITKVSWSADSDPLAGAVITYDPARSLFLVSGSYSFSVSYQAGGKPVSGNSSGGYRSELFWDGTRPVLVDIVKSS